MMTIEHRTLPITEIRADTTGRQIVGIAASYLTLSSDLGGFREQIAPTAFTRSLAESPNILALYSHNSAMLLGTTRSGTLALSSNDKGLLFDLHLPDTTYGNDVLELMRRGDLKEMSFGFWTRKDTWDTSSGEKIRTLHDVDLREISIVADPAYPVGTQAAQRSLSSHQSRTVMERALRFLDLQNRRR